MEITRTTDDAQTTLGNGLAGHAGVALQEVLDVGYGTGSTMLAVARESTPASFRRATALPHAFAPARFDMILSRFGAMCFKGS